MRMFFSLAEIRDSAQFINCTTQAYYSLKFSPFFSFFFTFVVCFTFFLMMGLFALWQSFKNQSLLRWTICSLKTNMDSTSSINK